MHDLAIVSELKIKSNTDTALARRSTCKSLLIGGTNTAFRVIVCTVCCLLLGSNRIVGGTFVRVFVTKVRKRTQPDSRKEAGV